MDYAISIKLTKKQYHLIKEMAHSEYRTIGNTVAMLAATGFKWYIEERDIYVKRMECDRDPEKGEYQYYTDQELKDTIDTMPFNQ